MNLAKLIKSTALCVSFAVLAASFSGCGSLANKIKYMFSPEPTLASKNNSAPQAAPGERKQTESGYGFNSLGSDQLKSIYYTIGEYLSKSRSEEFKVESVTVSMFDEALGAYEMDHPEVFWLNLESRYSYVEYSDYSVGFELNFILDGGELEEAKDAFDKKVNEIVESAPAQAGEYQTEVFINNYLIDNCDYRSDDSMRHNAYGALVRGAAVCDGYSKAFQILCNRLGVDCVGINGFSPEFNKENGESSDTGHMWNCVKIGGNWYHIDVTWNDGDAHIQRYLYFNVTTDEIKKNHTISPMYNSNADSKQLYNFFVPECTSEEYNYYKRECVTISNLDNDSDLLAAFLQAVRRGDQYFDFLISTDLDYKETTQAISDSYGYQWIEAVNSYNRGGSQISSECKFYTYDSINAVTFALQYI